MIVLVYWKQKTIRVAALTSFYNLLVSLEERLGAVLLPIDHKAVKPDRLISSNAAFLELTRLVASEIFLENGCKTKDDTVALYPTLDALGRIKKDQKNREALDLVAADFLEQIGTTVIQVLPHEARVSSKLTPSTRSRSQRS